MKKKNCKHAPAAGAGASGQRLREKGSASQLHEQGNGRFVSDGGQAGWKAG